MNNEILNISQVGSVMPYADYILTNGWDKLFGIPRAGKVIDVNQIMLKGGRIDSYIKTLLPENSGLFVFYNGFKRGSMLGLVGGFLHQSPYAVLNKINKHEIVLPGKTFLVAKDQRVIGRLTVNYAE